MKGGIGSAALQMPDGLIGPDGRAVLFHADDGSADLEGGWSSLCPQMRLERVPGNHYSLLRKPHVEVLAERLGRYVADAVAAEKVVRYR